MYTFRIGQPFDLTWLERAAAAATWESLSPDERAGATPAFVAGRTAQQVREAVGTPGGMAIIANWRGRPAGFILAFAAPDAGTEEVLGHLLMLWVAPDHRRRGLGRQLQALAEGLFERMGVRKVKLWTGVHNEAALRLATRAGYVPEGIIGLKEL